MNSMTNVTDEPRNETLPSDPPTAFDVPGDRPYSMIRNVPCYLAEEGYAKIIASFQLFASVRDSMFENAIEQDEPQPQQQQQAQPQRQQPQQRTAAQGQSAGTGVFCPEHGGVECLKTRQEYDKDGDRYYHPLPEGDQYYANDGRLVKNHNLYLRQTINVDGESNVDAANAMRNGSGENAPVLTDADFR
jgi:hypothetical protein